jgi:addiction module HigA family antidote
MSRRDTHPGPLLRLALARASLTAAEAARRMGVSLNLVSEIQLGKRRITPATAIKLSFVCDVPARDWLYWQAEHDLAVARARARKRSGVNLAAHK